MSSAVTFAKQYDQNFRQTTIGYSHNEIPLFRALHNTLAGLNSSFEVEEYHGGSHQVTFKGDGKPARFKARCELSDLLIIVFSSQQPHRVRLTYLQAKSERAQLSSVHGRKFTANLEQWFLLSKRKQVLGVGAFIPPHDILSSAILPSVGSFGFFYKDNTGDFQIHYVSADCLNLAGKYTQRNGKLIVNTSNCTRWINGYEECVFAEGNVSFAKALYRLKIGTPIVDGNPLASNNIRDWLASNLQRLIESAPINDRRTELAKELVTLLDTELLDASNSTLGAKNIILIKSQVEPNN